MNISVLMSDEFKESFFALIGSKGKIPIPIAMKILNLKRYLEEKGQDAETLRNDFIERFGKRKEDGELISINGHYEITISEESQSAWNDFNMAKIDIPVDFKISEEEFSKLNIEVTVSQLQLLLETIVTK